MLGQLIKKEILEHLMSLRFAIACVLCLIVILCSLFVRCQDYGQVLDDYHQESAIEKQRIERMDGPWELPWQGMTVFRRPNALKVFVRGVSDIDGGAVQVSARDPLRLIVRGVQNAAVPLFPSIDLVAFVGLIMSLMAIVFGYDAICGEKERGTLRLMLSYSVPRHSVLLAKWIGGYVTLVLPFLLTVLAGATIVLVQPTISLDGGQWNRLLAILGLALLYIMAMYSLALYVSCLTRRPATSVMLLLTVWVILVLGIPNLSPHLAQMWRPAANAEEVGSAREAAREEIWDAYEEQEKAYRKKHGIGDNWWEKINRDDWSQMEKIFNMRIWEWQLRQKSTLKMQDRLAKIDQRYGRRMDAQIALNRWIARVSPFSCFAFAATELADAGVMAGDRYMTQLRKYQKDFTIYGMRECLLMERKAMENKGKWPGPWYRHRDKPVPTFNYVPPAGGDYVRAVAVDGGILVVVTLVLFMLSYVSFLRYDVR